MLSGFTIDKKEYVALIFMEDGNRWREPVHVKKYMNISKDEWDKISKGGDFELVDEVSEHLQRGFQDKPESQIEEEEEEPELPEDEGDEEGIMQLAELFEEEGK